jgi:prepilin-type N-terminal cleavage/methylation domain-containing protein
MTRFNPPNLLRRGFSLIEILFAIFILGIGLLMIAAVFPIAIKWTNQDVQSTIGLVISRSAVAQLKAGGLTGVVATIIPGLSATVPQPYRYGTQNPTPSVGIVQPTYAYTTNDLNARYWWQAVVVPVAPTTNQGVADTPNAASTSNTTYQVYIFVFSKGNVNNTYHPQLMIHNSNSTTLAPSLYEIPYSGAGSATSMPVGAIGLDLATGAVVRKEIINPPGGGAPYVGLSEQVGGNNQSDEILFAPPAIGQQKSPLVYIYATTVTF